jgi:hypothetical protein
LEREGKRLREEEICREKGRGKETKNHVC